MTVLTDPQVDAVLPGLAGWQRRDGTLRRSVDFATFLAGIEAVRRVAERAEAVGHHPDIDIRWRTIIFSLITHSVGGITENDVQLARDINAILAD